MTYWSHGSAAQEMEPQAWSPWDHLILGGYELPGLAVVSTPGLERKLDVAKAPASDGATLTDQGREPARIEVTLRLWTREHHDSWWRISKELMPAVTKRTRRALDVYHPGLELLGIHSVYLIRLGIPEPSVDPGVMDVPLTLLEYRPIRNVSATTPQGSTRSLSDFRTALPAVAGATPPSQNAAVTEPPPEILFTPGNFTPGG